MLNLNRELKCNYFLRWSRPKEAKYHLKSVKISKYGLSHQQSLLCLTLRFLLWHFQESEDSRRDRKMGRQRSRSRSSSRSRDRDHKHNKSRVKHGKEGRDKGHSRKDRSRSRSSKKSKDKERSRYRWGRAGNERWLTLPFIECLSVTGEWSHREAMNCVQLELCDI